MTPHNPKNEDMPDEMHPFYEHPLDPNLTDHKEFERKTEAGEPTQWDKACAVAKVVDLSSASRHGAMLISAIAEALKDARNQGIEYAQDNCTCPKEEILCVYCQAKSLDGHIRVAREKALDEALETINKKRSNAKFQRTEYYYRDHEEITEAIESLKTKGE